MPVLAIASRSSLPTTVDLDGELTVLADQLEQCLVVDVPALARARFEQRLQLLAEPVAFTAEPAGTIGRINGVAPLRW